MVLIRSLHGRFTFKMQKYKRSGIYQNYFSFRNEFVEGSYLSERLQEYACWLSLTNSYEKVEKLLDRLTYNEVLSSQKIHDLVVSKATEISEVQSKDILAQDKNPLPSLSTSVDVYSDDNEELLMFEDGILVKGQKYYRASKNRPAPSKAGKKKRPTTNIASLPNQAGGSTYLIGGIGDKASSLAEVLRGHLKKEFSATKAPLNLVCITDGASQIHTRYVKAFGVKPIRILDWYHLKKKVDTLCKMICFGKEKKKKAVKKMLSFLWQGDTDKALTYLQTEVEIRQVGKQEELITYLNNHRAAIIDYERRQKAGKIIGSGCMETAVKQAVATRQKKRGMTWVPTGSSALAILTVKQMNGQWDNIWSFNQIINN